MKPVLVIAIILLAVSLPGQAAATSLESCAAIADPVERLACYDALAGRLPADTAKAGGKEPGAADPAAPGADVIVPDAPAENQAVRAVEAKPNAEAVFGLESKQKKEEEPPDKLQLKWAVKMKDAYGKWIITMENGQVWHQTDSRRFIFANPEHWVVISRGLLGSFFLGEPERNGSIRVKRVK